MHHHCERLESSKSDFAFSVFERTFKDFEILRAIRPELEALGMPITVLDEDGLEVDNGAE